VITEMYRIPFAAPGRLAAYGWGSRSVRGWLGIRGHSGGGSRRPEPHSGGVAGTGRHPRRWCTPRRPRPSDAQRNPRAEAAVVPDRPIRLGRDNAMIEGGARQLQRRKHFPAYESGKGRPLTPCKT